MLHVEWCLGGQGSVHRTHERHSALAGRSVRGARCYRLRLESALVVLLLLLVIGLPTLAHATLPDPIWIAGIYDAADFDDVVWILTNADLAGQSARAALDRCAPGVAEYVPSAAAFAPRAIAAYVLRPRSPPLG